MLLVGAAGKEFPFPYARLQPPLGRGDRIREVFVDPELGREGFTYRTTSGQEGSVPLDAVLEYNRDPSYVSDQLLYRLTVDAVGRIESSDLSVREVARRLNTSPAQLYRLLDTTNYSKTIDQMIALLSVLGCDVELAVNERPKDPVQG